MRSVKEEREEKTMSEIARILLSFQFAFSLYLGLRLNYFLFFTEQKEKKTKNITSPSLLCLQSHFRSLRTTIHSTHSVTFGKHFTVVFHGKEHTLIKLKLMIRWFVYTYMGDKDRTWWQFTLSAGCVCGRESRKFLCPTKSPYRFCSSFFSNSLILYLHAKKNKKNMKWTRASHV